MKPIPPKHYLSVIACTNGKPTTYRAPCGYESGDPKEFTSPSNPSVKGVTCLACVKFLERATLLTEVKP